MKGRYKNLWSVSGINAKKEKSLEVFKQPGKSHELSMVV
jgi:hypothetical protein